MRFHLPSLALGSLLLAALGAAAAPAFQRVVVAKPVKVCGVPTPEDLVYLYQPGVLGPPAVNNASPLPYAVPAGKVLVLTAVHLSLISCNPAGEPGTQAGAASVRFDGDVVTQAAFAPKTFTASSTLPAVEAGSTVQPVPPGVVAAPGTVVDLCQSGNFLRTAVTGYLADA